MGPVRVHGGCRRDVVRQKGRRHRRLGVEIGHAAGRHRHVVVIEAVLRRETCRRLQVPLRIDIRRDGGDGGGRRAVVRVAEPQEFLDRERRPLRHRLRRLVQDAGRRHVDRVL